MVDAGNFVSEFLFRGRHGTCYGLVLDASAPSAALPGSKRPGYSPKRRFRASDTTSHASSTCRMDSGSRTPSASAFTQSPRFCCASARSRRSGLLVRVGSASEQIGSGSGGMGEDGKRWGERPGERDGERGREASGVGEREGRGERWGESVAVIGGGLKAESLGGEGKRGGSGKGDIGGGSGTGGRMVSPRRLPLGGVVTLGERKEALLCLPFNVVAELRMRRVFCRCLLLRSLWAFSSTFGLSSGYSHVINLSVSSGGGAGSSWRIVRGRRAGRILLSGTMRRMRRRRSGNVRADGMQIVWTGNERMSTDLVCDVEDCLLEQDDSEVIESLCSRRGFGQIAALGVEGGGEGALGRDELTQRSQISEFTGIMTGVLGQDVV